MFLGTEKEWIQIITTLALALIALGAFVGWLFTWLLSGPTQTDICAMQGGSFNSGVCYIKEETSRE